MGSKLLLAAGCCRACCLTAGDGQLGGLQTGETAAAAASCLVAACCLAAGQQLLVATATGNGRKREREGEKEEREDGKEDGLLLPMLREWEKGRKRGREDEWEEGSSQPRQPPPCALLLPFITAGVHRGVEELVACCWSTAVRMLLL